MLKPSYQTHVVGSSTEQMMSSQNSGKYLFGKWQKERNNAMKEGAVQDDYSLGQLELSDHDVSGVHSKETYETETTPLDPLSPSRTRDIRDVPERGGKE